jgi:hypothetical protein
MFFSGGQPISVNVKLSETLVVAIVEAFSQSADPVYTGEERLADTH